MDNPYDHQADQTNKAVRRQAVLRLAMEQSDRDVTIGDTVPPAEALAELDEAAEQLEVRLRARLA